MPSCSLTFYKGFLKRKKIFEEEKLKNVEPCQKCGYLTTTKICAFCRMKEKLNKFIKR